MKKHTFRFAEVLPILTILLVGAYLRLYRISEYMTFLGDEGRDALIVKRMITDGKWTLLGPTASVGGFFMGPIYYYFMLPFLWLWNLNPVGPAIMVALTGIATIGLVYWVSSRLFDRWVGLIAASLYALSPLVVSYSRSSWNPNVVPFFAIILFYFLWETIAQGAWKRLFWIGMLLGILLQLHYTVLSVFGVVFIWFFLFGRDWKYVRHYAMGIGGFLVGFSPFLAFEVRHGFMNIRSILMFVFEGKDTGFSLINSVSNMTDVFFRLFGRLILRVPEKGALGNLPFMEKTVLTDTTWIMAIGSLVLFLVFALRRSRYFKAVGIAKDRQEGFRLGMLLMALWVGIVLCFFGFYKKSIYDYYLGMMYFIPFMSIGLLAFTFMRIGRWWRVLTLGAVAGLLVYNWQGMPFRYPPNNQLGQVERISREIVDNTQGKPFNFALITGGNSDHAYRYFFELWNRAPVTIENTAIDPERKTVTDQLLIVCEDIFCKPLGNSLWEVAGFGRAEIVKEWDVSVVKLYRLVHYTGGE